MNENASRRVGAVLHDQWIVMLFLAVTIALRTLLTP